MLKRSFFLFDCSEAWVRRITVSGGSFSATVPARSAIAIHTGALGTGSGTGTGGGGTSTTVAVSWAETATTTFGEVSYIHSQHSPAQGLISRSEEHFPRWKHLTAGHLGPSFIGNEILLECSAVVLTENSARPVVGVVSCLDDHREPPPQHDLPVQIHSQGDGRECEFKFSCFASYFEIHASIHNFPFFIMIELLTWTGFRLCGNLTLTEARPRMRRAHRRSRHHGDEMRRQLSSRTTTETLY